MKITHLCYSGFGGSTDLVFSLIAEDKKKIFSHYIQFYGPELIIENKKRAKKLNINFKFIKKFNFLINYMSSILNLFFIRPDVILLNNFLIIPCVIYKLIFFKTKIIYINHTPRLNLTWKDKFITYFNIFISKYVILNIDSCKFYKENFKIKTDKLSIIQNCINTKFYKKKRKVSNKFFKIGMACRLDKKQKRYDLILKSLLTKKLKNLDIKFSLAGSGDDFENFKKQVLKNNLTKKVIIEGYLTQNNLRKWYETLDLYIQASLYEGMSISILQAMSMKIPTIGSRVAGISDILEKKKFVGKTFKNNAIDLSKCIKYFYNMNKSLRNKYVKTQYNYIISNNSSEIVFNKYKNLIIKIKKL